MMKVYIVLDVDGNIFSVNYKDEDAQKDARACNGHVEIWSVN